MLGRFAAPLDALETAAQTGRLLIRRGAIARKIEVDGSGRVRGVVWIDHQSRTEQRADAPLVFLCASTLESTRLLLLSRSPRSPDGLGATSGVLGRFLMDHVRLRAGEGATIAARAFFRGGTLHIPSALRHPRFVGTGSRPGLRFASISKLDKRPFSELSAACFGECFHRPENRVTLDPKLLDAWGIPVLQIDCSHGDAELLRAREQAKALRELSRWLA